MVVSALGRARQGQLRNKRNQYIAFVCLDQNHCFVGQRAQGKSDIELEIIIRLLSKLEDKHQGMYIDFWIWFLSSKIHV